MTILAKTIFASPVFTAENRFFPPSGKNLPTLHHSSKYYASLANS